MQQDYDIRQYYVQEDHEYAGATYGAVMADLRTRKCLPIGLRRKTGPTSENEELLKLPPDDTPVETGDYVLLILDGSRGDRIRELFGVEEGI